MYGRPSCSPTSKIVTVLGACESRATASASRVKRAADRVVVCEPVRQQLDGDDPREVGVLRPVDLAHAAPRDQLRVPVAVGKLALVHHDGLPRLGAPENASEYPASS